MQEVRSNIQEVLSIMQEVRSYIQEVSNIIQEVRSYIKKCAVIFKKSTVNLQDHRSRANQLTGFYMIGPPVIKELNPS